MARKLLKALSPVDNVDRNSLALKFSRDLNSSIFELFKSLEKANKSLISCSTKVSDAEFLLETNPWFKRMHSDVLNRARDLDKSDYLSSVKNKVNNDNPESARI